MFSQNTTEIWNSNSTDSIDVFLDGFADGIIEGTSYSVGPTEDTDFMSIARLWTDLGFNIIPGNVDKTPKVKFAGWSGEGAATVPDELLADWAESYSDATPLLLPDSGSKGVKLVVADADDPKMSPWISDQYGQSPFIVATGRDGGGAHHYYLQPNGPLVTGRNKEIGPDSGVETWSYEIEEGTSKVVKAKGWGKTKIDIKARRNYIVAPGALHKSGRRYTAGLDVNTITVDWLKANLPVFNNELYEKDVEKAKDRRVQKEKEIAKLHPTTASTTARTSKAGKPYEFIPADYVCTLKAGGTALLSSLANGTLVHCPSGTDGHDDAKVYSGDGRTSIHCFHSSCEGKSWIVGVPKPKFLLHKSGRLAGMPINDRVENTRELLRYSGTTIAYNEMTKGTEYGFTEGEGRTANDAEAEIRELGRRHEFRPGKDVFDEHVRIIRREHSYHPVRQWIESKAWDGVDRFPALVGSLKLAPGMNPDLAQILLFRWCLSAAAVIERRDGVKVEGVLVLVGRQDVFKTTWINSLAPLGIADGRSLDPSDKDSVMGAIRNWIVELGELDATFRKADLARLKAFLSQTVDTIRLPYDRREDTFPRRTVFAASVNDTAYLRDPTGNRRYWTISVDSCDPKHGVDMQQLWAQMLSLHRKGERHWLVKAETAALNEQNLKHVEPDPIETAIERCYTPDVATWTAQPEIREAIKDAFSSWGQREARGMTAVLRRWADTLRCPARRSNGEVLWPVRAHRAAPSTTRPMSEKLVDSLLE